MSLEEGIYGNQEVRGTIDDLSSHQENLEYYQRSSTETLLRFVPQAQCDVAETAMRLNAILAVLEERGAPKG